MTCEDYVIKRLTKIEKELESTKEELEHYKTNDVFAHDAFEFLRQLFTVEISTDGTARYVTCTNIWEKFDSEEYKRLVRLLKLDVPKLEGEEIDDAETTDTV